MNIPKIIGKGFCGGLLDGGPEAV